MTSTLLITGANRGLGFEFARQYVAEGKHVIATCRAPEKAEALQKLAQQYTSVKIEKLDITDQASIDALAEKLKDLAIDILINNAGIATGREEPVWVSPDKNDQRFGSIDPSGWAHVLHTNTIAPIMVTQAFMPHIRRGKERKIVMISSRCGSIEQAMYPEYIAYGTSKAALNMAMRNVATTLQPENIIVVSLNPGWVKTYMGGEEANLRPDVSVGSMRKIIAGLTLQQSGSFLRYNGELIAW